MAPGACGGTNRPVRAALLTALSLVMAFLCLSPAGVSASRGAPHSPLLARQDSDDPVWLAAVRRWRAAVDDHEPGTADAPVVGINAWPRRDLLAVLTDLVALRDLLAKAHAKPSLLHGAASRQVLTYRHHALPASEVEDLLGVTTDEAARGDLNRLLKRGAMLNTDAATLLPFDVLRSRTLDTQLVRGADGRVRGFEGTVHWDVARALLDEVTPSPSGDAFVRSWYRATAAHLLRRSTLAYADPQLERARQLFPEDPVILFDSGCLHEAYASPAIQGLARSAPASAGVNVGGPAANWQRAERFLRQALASDARMTDARLRLGRVVGLLGRHQEAIAELRRALETAGDDLARYYAEMFLGCEEQMLGHGDAARAHYERAVRLYPSAQSPHLALAQIGQQDGNRSAALAAIERLFVVTSAPDTIDPWWTYIVAPFRDADDLLTQCRRAILTKEPS